MHIADRINRKKWGVFRHYLYNIQNNPLYYNNQNGGETDWQACTQALKEEFCAYAQKVTAAGGVVIFDYKLSRDGSFDDEQVEALQCIGHQLK